MKVTKQEIERILEIKSQVLVEQFLRAVLRTNRLKKDDEEIEISLFDGGEDDDDDGDDSYKECLNK